MRHDSVAEWLTADRREAMPRFVRKPHNCVVPEGKTASFKCKVLASSPPVITWSVNDLISDMSCFAHCVTLHHLKKRGNRFCSLSVKY